jgi:hypothetical protein
MITYNPSLKKLNTSTITSINDGDNEEHDEDMPKEVANDANVQFAAQFAKQFAKQSTDQIQYATRKNVGTSGFSTGKTFSQMFEENNALFEANLENIPESIINDSVLVFNIEHPENKIIAPKTRNFNTLCAVYKLKSDEMVSQEWSAIEKIAYSEENVLAIKNAFVTLGYNMVVPVHVSIFKKQIAEFNVKVNLPEVISSFEKSLQDGTKMIVPIDQVSLEQLKSIIGTKNKFFQGYIIYGINGERTKISNPKYKEIRDLKGNKPITLEQWNTKNLFYVYWKLMREQKIEAFLKEFQTPENCPNGSTYLSLFQWFANSVRFYAQNLYTVYQMAFVRRQMNKTDIPYSMKPLCGDIHKAYMETKLPTSITMVEQYLFTQPCGKIFWRIFTTPQQQEQSKHHVKNTRQPKVTHVAESASASTPVPTQELQLTTQ